MTKPTNKPIPSNDVIDFKFNAEKIDEVVNSNIEKYVDRFGIDRYTLEGIRKNLSPLGNTYTQEQAEAAITSGEIIDGAFFFIWSGNERSIADMYQNIGGVITATGKSLPAEKLIEITTAKINQLFIVKNNIWDGVPALLGYNNSEDQLTVAPGSENFKSAIVPIEPNTKYIVRGNGDRFRIGTHPEYPKVNDIATEMTWPRGANGADYDATTGKPYDIIEFTTPANARYLMIAYTSTNQDVKLFVVKSDNAKNINLVQFGAGFKAESVDAIGRVTGENIRNGKNLADISKKYPRYIPGNLSVGDVIDLSTESDPAHMRSLYVRVQPNTAYTVAKDATDGFRIGFTNRHPDLGAQIRVVHVDGLVNTATVTSGDNEYFMVVTFNQSYLRQPGAIMVQEGAEFTGFESYGTLMQTAAPISRSGEKLPWQPIDSRIRRGKNLFDGNYQIAWLSGSPTDNSGAYQIDGPNGRTAVIRVPRNTVVTISKTDSDRMRIAGIKWLPLHQSAVEFLTDTHMDGHNIVTVNTRDNDYLLIYVSITGVPPSFMQVELGPTKTAWQTYGDELVNPAVNIEDGHDTDDGTVGNANYLLKPAGATEYGAYADAAGTIPATDDTEALKLKILAASQTGKLEFDAGKNYLVSDTLMIDPALIRTVEGNNAAFITSVDKPVFHVKGRLTTDAGPENVWPLSIPEASSGIYNIRTFGVNRKIGVGLVVEQTFGLKVQNCFFSYGRTGIEFRGFNRNIIVTGNHIFAHNQYGWHFTESLNLHQGTFCNNMMMHSWKNIYGENTTIYNITISNNDIENGYWFFGGEDFYNDCNIHFKQTTNPIQDVRIQNNTLEDHWRTQKSVHFEGLRNSSFAAIAFVGNRASNTLKNVIVISGMSGGTFTGNNFGTSYGSHILVNGFVNGVNISGNNFDVDRGSALEIAGAFDVWTLKFDNNNLFSNCRKNPVLVKVNNIRNASFSNNLLSVNGDTYYDKTRGAIDVQLNGNGQAKLLRADNNNLMFGSVTGITKGISFPASTVGKSAFGNISDVEGITYQ